MRALTLRQPWATLVVLGEKGIETRGFRPVTALAVGQWFGVHASQAPVDMRATVALRTFERALARHGFNQWAELPRGALLGFAQYAGAARTEELLRARDLTDRGDQVRQALRGWPVPLSYQEQCFGDYGADRWGWRLPDVRRLPLPLPCRGSQGLWELPDALRVEALRQLEQTGAPLISREGHAHGGSA